MSADQLAEALWGDQPPASWPKIVQGCVLRLRRTLGQDTIETTSGGYRLTSGGDEVDTARFEHFVERGRALVVAGESERAAIAFDSALALWRGPPFDVLDGWPPGQIEAARLDELRRTAEERLLDARLASGEHREVAATPSPGRGGAAARAALGDPRPGPVPLRTPGRRPANAAACPPHSRRAARHRPGRRAGRRSRRRSCGRTSSLAARRAAARSATSARTRGSPPYDVDDHEASSAATRGCGLRRAAADDAVVGGRTGPSGCGKSSLVRAGLVPGPASAGSPGAPSSSRAATRTRRSPRRARRRRRRRGPRGRPVRGAVHARRLTPRHGRGVLSQRSPTTPPTEAPVVVVVRADQLSGLTLDRRRFSRPRRTRPHLVGPLTGDALREAIEGPAAQAGLRLERGLVDLLVRDTEGEPGACRCCRTLSPRRGGAATATCSRRGLPGDRRHPRRRRPLRRPPLREPARRSSGAILRRCMLRLVAPIGRRRTGPLPGRRAGRCAATPTASGSSSLLVRRTARHRRGRTRSSSPTRRWPGHGRGCSRGSTRTPPVSASCATLRPPLTDGSRSADRTASCTEVPASTRPWSGRDEHRPDLTAVEDEFLEASERTSRRRSARTARRAGTRATPAKTAGSGAPRGGRRHAGGCAGRRHRSPGAVAGRYRTAQTPPRPRRPTPRSSR